MPLEPFRWDKRFYKRRSDFNSKDEYKVYVRSVIKQGMQVRCIEGSFKGQVGKLVEDDGTSNPFFDYGSASRQAQTLYKVEIIEGEDEGEGGGARHETFTPRGYDRELAEDAVWFLLSAAGSGDPDGQIGKVRAGSHRSRPAQPCNPQRPTAPPLGSPADPACCLLSAPGPEPTTPLRPRSPLNRQAAVVSAGLAGVERDPADALSLWRAAADAGHPDGHVALGLCAQYGYRDGGPGGAVLVPPDGDEAADRFNAAVAAGDAQAGGLSMAPLPQKPLR